MPPLTQRQVSWWVIVPLLFAAMAGGVYAGVRAQAPTVTYDYTVELQSGTSSSVALEYGVWPALAHADFFNTVRAQFIAQQASFVEANLTTMELAVYRDGVEALRVPIKSKGREGSWWETPAGLYKAQGKEENHFSSFGHVYMPYSIPFQGNFFIHGWPYYPDGTPVDSKYSGGCIRLEDTYAAQVYDLVTVGMPILVYEERSDTDTFAYELDAPALSTDTYLVADLDNNFVLLGANTDQAVHTRILPKLMTALVASEYQNIEHPVPVRASALAGVAESPLVSGATYTIYDLFFPLLRRGDTAAARALAAYFGERRFVTLQNEKAHALGMNATMFTDAAGEDAGNNTTAEDLFSFLKYLVSNRSFLLAMSAGTVNLATYGESVFSGMKSNHPLLTVAGFGGGLADVSGIPTLGGVSPESDTQPASVALVFARTADGALHDDGPDLVSVVHVPFHDGTVRTLAVIVLDARDPDLDARAMLEHVTHLYR